MTATETLPPGWTSSYVEKWEIRRGDPTTLIKFNIDTVDGIGTVGEVRDWLLNEGYRIDKEWWEQNEFYVIRIWGTISEMWWEMAWGPAGATYYYPPTGPRQITKPQPGRPPAKPIPQPTRPGWSPCAPTTTQPPKGSKGTFSPPATYDPNYTSTIPEPSSPQLPAPHQWTLPIDVYWAVWNFMFNNQANINAYINFYFPGTEWAASFNYDEKIQKYQQDVDMFWTIAQDAWNTFIAKNVSSDPLYYLALDFAVNFIFGSF